MKKCVAVLLLLCLFALPLAACGDEAPASSASVSDSASLSTERFDGATLKILGKDPSSHTFAKQQWVNVEENEGDVINEAVKNRQYWLEETYGIKIEYYNVSSEDYFITAEVERQMTSGLCEYDVFCDGLTTMATIAANGYLVDLAACEYINLDNPWWDKGVTENLSIGGKVYYAAGDLLITDDDYTYCVLYNKNIFNNRNMNAGYDNRTIYEIVEDGDWTLDTMNEFCSMMPNDSSGDGAMTLDDDYGLIMDNGCVQVLMAGSGYRMAGKDENDVPYLSVQSDSALSIFSRVMNITRNNYYLLVSEKIPSTSQYGDSIRQFGTGKALFYMPKLSGVSQMRSFTDLSFGVLPIPKFDSDQEKYYNCAAPLHFTLVGIPLLNSGDNLRMTCTALEALGYMGREKVTEAYIETTLKLKRVEAQEDADMIDLIINNRTFDLALMFNWGGLNVFFNPFAGTDNMEFVSTWESKKTMAESDMNATLEKLIQK